MKLGPIIKTILQYVMGLAGWAVIIYLVYDAYFVERPAGELSYLSKIISFGWYATFAAIALVVVCVFMATLYGLIATFFRDE